MCNLIAYNIVAAKVFVYCDLFNKYGKDCLGFVNELCIVICVLWQGLPIWFVYCDLCNMAGIAWVLCIVICVF